MNQQMALRRRLMRGGKKMWMITVNHTPQGSTIIDYWTKVSVGGVTLGDGTYTFPDGTNIVCWANSVSNMGHGTQIIIDGVVVAAGSGQNTAITYDYILKSNCQITKNVNPGGPFGKILITTK